MVARHTPQRIACLQPSATVILDAIGELERVVACTRYCADVVPAVRNGGRAILADSWTANTEQIVAANPDLVIASVPYQEKAVVEILKSGGRFLGLAPKTLADIYTDIATIAGAVGASDRGESVIEAMQQKIADTRRRPSANAAHKGNSPCPRLPGSCRRVRWEESMDRQNSARRPPRRSAAARSAG